jgi:DNA-binding winged helix-turn-helix (wHTH) protein
MPLRIYLTGRVLVEESDTVLLDERRMMGKQGRLAFAYLVGEHLRAVSRDELAEELWLGTVPVTTTPVTSGLYTLFDNATHVFCRHHGA